MGVFSKLFENLFFIPRSRSDPFTFKIYEDLVNTNFIRLGYSAIFLLFLSIINLIFDYLINSPWSETYSHMFLPFDFFLFTFSILLLLLVYKFHWFGKSQRQIWVYTFVFIVLTWCTGISVIEYSSMDSFPTLIAGIFYVSIAFFIDGLYLFFLFLFQFSVLLLIATFHFDFLSISPSRIYVIAIMLPIGFIMNKILLKNRMEASRDKLLLHEANLELERRVDSRTQEISKANESLKTLIHEKTGTEVDLRELNQTLSSILKSIPLPVFATDNDGVVRYIWNSAAEKELGWKKSEVFEKVLPMIEPEELQKTLQKNALAIGEINTGVELEFTRKNGVKSIFNVYRTPIKTKDIHVQHLFLLVDLTEIKKYEMALKKAWKKAEESDMLKTAFLTNMSHEIRTPLNGILGFSSLLKNNTLSQEKKDTYFDIISTNSDHLLSIVENIIEISKIESGQVEVVEQDIDIYQLIAQMESSITKYAKVHHGGEVQFVINKPEIPIPPIIITDGLKLAHILNNLLRNAFKFTETGTVTLGYEVYNESNLLFYVKDTGIGMSKKVIDVIFQSFRQVDDSSTRKYGGSGLGLAICKGLLTQMNGKIWVESKLKSGSTFYFIIPLLTPPTKQLFNKHESGILNLRGKTLLVVEDDFASSMYFDEILAPTMATILHASSGVPAIEICKNHPVDLVLMDIQLPGMDGYQTTQEIRKFNPYIPIIAQSANALNEHRQKSLHAGCNDFITKPINPQHLLEVIRFYIGKTS